ncbi:MAG: N-formylglutamate amidohydrolase [Gemmatimonadota bacterium]|nr:N-formylglutamate amidohydrolase [Gemmatimonadota bacterium]
MSDRPSLILTCEHASNAIPQRFKKMFKGGSAALKSNRGWDPGAKRLARSLAKNHRVPLVETKVSRLLVEVNRSEHHPALFSDFLRSADDVTKSEILDRHYRPHRAAVLELVRRKVNRGNTVLHVGVHTFAPRLNGSVRKADIGLLYDPARDAELDFVSRWKAEIKSVSTQTVVRRNYPYRGASDGLTTTLRRMFSGDEYLGVELEVNQKFFQPTGKWKVLADTLSETLKRAIR